METAINLLQNDKGVMKLSIPISGSLNDPQFDLSNAIGQAIAGAMQKTILTAVRIAFPLGTVVASAIRRSGSSRSNSRRAPRS